MVSSSLLFCVVGLFAHVQCSISNIGFVGRGYDMFRANPRPSSTLFDPGYVSAILNTREQNQTSAGVKQCKACEHSFQLFEITKMDDYEATSGTVSAWKYSGLLFGARGSTAHQEITQETSASNQVLVDFVAKCSFLCLDSNVYSLSPTDLTDNFRKAVEILGTPELSYEMFLWMFGTHFVTRTKLGSMMWQRMTFTAEDWRNIRTLVTTTEKSIQAGLFFKHTVGTKGTRDEELWSDAASVRSLTRDIFSLGTEITKVSEWIYPSESSPMPISMTVYPITDLFSTELFPNDNTIDQKRNRLIRTIEDGSYCKFLLGTQGKKGTCEKEPRKARNALDPASSVAFSPCPDVFGGVYLTGLGSVKNHITGSSRCPDRYRPYPIVTQKGTNNGLHLCLREGATLLDQTKVFGGFYATLERYWVRMRQHCDKCGLFKLWKCRCRQVVDSKGVETVGSDVSNSRDYVHNNPFTGGRSCPPGFSSYHLGSFIQNRDNCDSCNGVVRGSEVYACFKPVNFRNGQSYLGGFAHSCPSSQYNRIAMIGNLPACILGPSENGSKRPFSPHITIKDKPTKGQGGRGRGGKSSRKGFRKSGRG